MISQYSVEHDVAQMVANIRRSQVTTDVSFAIDNLRPILRHFKTPILVAAILGSAVGLMACEISSRGAWDLDKEIKTQSATPTPKK